MTNSSHNDDELVAFLRQHRPLPPPPGKKLEGSLFELVDRQEPTYKSFPGWVWFFPSAIAASLVIWWGSDRLFVPSAQVVQEQMELETFLVNTWNDAVGSTLLSIAEDSQENDSFPLTDITNDSLEDTDTVANY